MWIFSEYCLSQAEIESAVSVIRDSLGSLPFVDEEHLTMAENTNAHTHSKTAPAVLADGTYASQSSAGTSAGLIKKDDAPSLRTLLLGGDYFLAAMTASTLTKIVLRLASTKGVPAESVNACVAEAMAYLCGMVRLGKSGVTTAKMDDDCHERLWLCLLVLSDPYNETMCEIWTQKCRHAYATLLVQKQKELSKKTDEKEDPKNKVTPLACILRCSDTDEVYTPLLFGCNASSGSSRGNTNTELYYSCHKARAYTHSH